MQTSNKSITPSVSSSSSNKSKVANTTTSISNSSKSISVNNNTNTHTIISQTSNKQVVTPQPTPAPTVNPYAGWTEYVETRNTSGVVAPRSKESGAGNSIQDLIEANTTASWDVGFFFCLSVGDYAQGVITLDQLKEKISQ